MCISFELIQEVRALPCFVNVSCLYVHMHIFKLISYVSLIFLFHLIHNLLDTLKSSYHFYSHLTLLWSMLYRCLALRPWQCRGSTDETVPSSFSMILPVKMPRLPHPGQ